MIVPGAIKDEKGRKMDNELLLETDRKIEISVRRRNFAKLTRNLAERGKRKVE